ncbi:MAG: LuxR C-terminal-related transcriptional regulator [Candidatus Aminicenantes bacterium]|nr:LuxR C-terminal-related transcriptional regulator [Candidatus Aminicenantes bacterium]MDH5707124.1 LuxR C-terminal-related transcriptional regulator [Candidatus Aminicenantes bacterium]
MKDKNRTKKQVTEELRKLHRKISELRKKEIEYQKADKREKRYVCDLKSLSKIALGFVDLPFEEDIYQFIAKQLKELVGDCMVLVNSFDEGSKTFCVRSILGIGKHMDNVIKILGRRPVGMSVPINDEARKGLTSRKLEKVPGGLYELSIGSIPKPACSAIEKLLCLGEANAMGFSWRGKLFASAVVFMRKGAEIGDPSIIETFIRQASVALQRRHVEEALHVAYEDLERRVKARTAELENINKKLQLEISERGRTGEALRESEEFNFALFQYNPIETIAVDRDGRVVKTNLAKRKSEEIWPNVGDVMYRDYAVEYEIDMYTEMMECIRSGRKKEFPEQKYEDKYHSISIAPFPEGAVITSQDITERKKAEMALAESEAKLREQKSALEEKNIALREVIAQIEAEKIRIKEDIETNVHIVLSPILEKLKMGKDRLKYVNLLEHYIDEITSSFGSKITRISLKLTAREIEVCNMIKGGLTNKDISNILNISCRTVEKHRQKIRHKLEISNQDVNLASFLREL